eukprot:5907945-Pleurochrysis_carterae.AAC.1
MRCFGNAREAAALPTLPFSCFPQQAGPALAAAAAPSEMGQTHSGAEAFSINSIAHQTDLSKVALAFLGKGTMEEVGMHWQVLSYVARGDRNGLEEDVQIMKSVCFHDFKSARADLNNLHQWT